MKDALVVGYGSIGKKHTCILSELGCNVSLVTTQNITDYPHFYSIDQALKAKAYDFAVIANATDQHHQSIMTFLKSKFNGKILVEKPLVSSIPSPIKQLEKERIFVAYNLRFHQFFQLIADKLCADKMVAFFVQVGSYLPDWRKKTDYRKSYSAYKERGGGVLRDLSHEIDYTLWLCGKPIEMTAMGGKYGTLQINSDDIFHILMRCENCPSVSIHLDYLSRSPFRKITIHTHKQNTIMADFISGELFYNGRLLANILDGIEESYYRQSKALLNNEQLCCYDEGLTVLQAIELIESASKMRKWVSL